MHVLVHGRYISQRSLSRIWHEVTGDSFVVHITKVRGLDAALAEVLKYVTKGITGASDPFYLAMVHMAFRRRRCLVTRGIFYNVHLRVLDRLSCGYCEGHLKVDFPLREAHLIGRGPLRYFEVYFRIPIDDS